MIFGASKISDANVLAGQNIMLMNGKLNEIPF